MRTAHSSIQSISNGGNVMTNVHRLEREIAALSETELVEFRRWYAEFDATLWDRQLASDVESGALDRVAEEAISEYRQGLTRPL